MIGCGSDVLASSPNRSLSSKLSENPATARTEPWSCATCPLSDTEALTTWCVSDSDRCTPRALGFEPAGDCGSLLEPDAASVVVLQLLPAECKCRAMRVAVGIGGAGCIAPAVSWSISDRVSGRMRLNVGGELRPSLVAVAIFIPGTTNDAWPEVKRVQSTKPKEMAVLSLPKSGGLA
eukprot:1746291-Pleurochrysis_carterae.AAC.2